MLVNIYYTKHALAEAGGAHVQATSTCEGLRSLGVEARLYYVEPNSHQPTDAELEADVFHFIGMYSASPQLIRLIKTHSQGIVALSTIYWWTPQVEKIMRGKGIVYYRYLLPRYIRRFLKSHIHSYKVVNESDLLLPNSPAEGELVKKNFPVSNRSLICPIPNGTSLMEHCHPPSSTLLNFSAPYVLCTGSFNIRKNQLSLIRALKNTDIHVIFVGKSSICGQGFWAEGANQWYVDQCQREASSRMHFVGHIRHRSPEWFQLFSCARAFAISSSCETPSLAALEAALLGIPVAITQEGSAPEYFGPHVAYCNPLSLESIQTAVEMAFHKGRDAALQHHVKDRFLWSNAARITALAYQAAISRKTEDWEAYRETTATLWFPHPDFTQQTIQS